MDLDDRPSVGRFLPFPMDECKPFVGGETNRVGGAFLQRGRLLGRFSRVRGIIVVLEIAIRVIVVILGLLILVDRFGEISWLRLGVLSGQYFDEIGRSLHCGREV